MKSKGDTITSCLTIALSMIIVRCSILALVAAISDFDLLLDISVI